MPRLSAAFAALAVSAAPCWAVDLPSNDVDRAIVCSVYGGFAPEADPRTAIARRAIDETVQHAVRSGLRSPEEVRLLFNETTQLAIDQEPREEIIANWNACRASFSP